MTFSNTTPSGTEGQDFTYTVHLNTDPTNDVTIVITSTAKATVAPTSLTFNNSNFKTPQTVTITPTIDDDGTDETATLTHDVSGYTGVGTNEISASIADKDKRIITVSQITDPIIIIEGSTAEYTVSLSTRPTAEVVITPASTNPAATVSDPLTFTNLGWSTDQVQTITITAVEDDNGTSDTFDITNTVSGGDYVSITANPVAVQITDNDTRTINITPATLNIAEGETKTYTISLATEPTDAIIITPASDNAAATIFGTQTFVFTAQNWQALQTVVILAVEDDNGVSEQNITITNTANNGDYQDITATIAINTIDNDPPIITASVNSLTAIVGFAIDPILITNTGGAITTYTISVGLPDGLKIDKITGKISGTPTDASSQTYTITATNSLGTDTAIISISVDRPEAPNITPSTNSLIAKANEVITPITFTNNNGGRANFYIIPVLPAGLTFNPSTGTISGTPITTTQGATKYTIFANNIEGTSKANITITISDTAPAIILSSHTDSDKYTVQLATEPSGDVTIEITNSDTNIDSSPLTFSTLNWDIAQTVTVTGTVDDNASITHTASSSGGYGGVIKTLTKPNISYDKTNTFTVGESVSIKPKITGSFATSYTIEPVLPAGQTLNPSTGTISSTPTTKPNAATYTITATNPLGKSTAIISIEVNDKPTAYIVKISSTTTFKFRIFLNDKARETITITITYTVSGDIETKTTTIIKKGNTYDKDITLGPIDTATTITIIKGEDYIVGNSKDITFTVTPPQPGLSDTASTANTQTPQHYFTTTAPTLLKATPIKNHKIKLTYQKAPTASIYNIYYDTTPPITPNLFHHQKAQSTQTTYITPKLPLQPHYFIITSEDEYNIESPASNQLQASPKK